jgi:N-acetyl-anhydromuramyl-L-alanine amidase AmpD
VVGHADIAPRRKPDPGPRFPWHALHEAGVGAWYDDAEVARQRGLLVGHEAETLAMLQAALAAYGYAVPSTGELDAATRDVLYAFQTHFLPGRRSGEADPGTVATALALVARYQPKAYAELARRFELHDAQ